MVKKNTVILLNQVSALVTYSSADVLDAWLAKELNTCPAQVSGPAE